MARRRADPALPLRAAGPNDTDYDHLMRVYDQVLAWAATEAGGDKALVNKLREAAEAGDEVARAALHDLLEESR